MEAKPLMTIGEIAFAVDEPLWRVEQAVNDGPINPDAYMAKERLWARDKVARIRLWLRDHPGTRHHHYTRIASKAALTALALLGLSIPGCSDWQLTRTWHFQPGTPAVLGPDVRTCPQAQFSPQSLPPAESPTELEPARPVYRDPRIELEVQPQAEPAPTGWRKVEGLVVPNVSIERSPQ